MCQWEDTNRYIKLKAHQPCSFYLAKKFPENNEHIFLHKLLLWHNCSMVDLNGCHRLKLTVLRRCQQNLQRLEGQCSKRSDPVTAAPCREILLFQTSFEQKS